MKKKQNEGLFFSGRSFAEVCDNEELVEQEVVGATTVFAAIFRRRT